MAPVVSVVIPCHNAERWVGEAIESVLAQTQRGVEVIVIDDGSTDGSLAVAQRFGGKIRWETGPNHGGNWARNRGFALSAGQYVQFLDADDYLLPAKIAHQVECLESTGADVVYGDWRHQRHGADGTVTLEPIHISGELADPLEALLRRWWVAPVAVLVRRTAVIACGGWDEALPAAQDTDFMISLALSGAKFTYLSGCESIYRRYGNVTVSTSNRRRWLGAHAQVVDKAERCLAASGRLTREYRSALASYSYSVARGFYDIDRNRYRAELAHALTLDPKFPIEGSESFRWCQRFLGFESAEWIASMKRWLVGIRAE